MMEKPLFPRHERSELLEILGGNTLRTSCMTTEINNQQLTGIASVAWKWRKLTIEMSYKQDKFY